MQILKLFILTNFLFLQTINGQEKSFENYLDQLLPHLIELNNVAGIAVGVIENGNISFKKTIGFANKENKKTLTDNTIFNLGSISKPMTSWGVMHLVKIGKIKLDEPVNNYLDQWKIISDTIDVSKVTVRTLLSHTSGLSLSAVPEYDPDIILPTLEEYLKSSNEIHFEYIPNKKWSYSGGGYMILQKVIEVVTNMDFEDYMENEILKPLGMTNSGYSWDPQLLKNAATPYNSGERAKYFNYVGKSAASFNSTLNDMLHWLSITLDFISSEVTDTTILKYNLLKEMITPAESSQRQYGLRYGLGYELWPLGEDSFLTGHNGQNTGWTSGLWFNPVSKNGLVVLINDSHGYNSWRWIFCDWMYWTSKISWQGICTGRPENLPSMQSYLGNKIK